MGIIRMTREQREYWEAKRNREYDKLYYTDEDGYERERERKLVIVQKYTPRRLNVRRTTGHRQRQAGTRSSAASGDGNDDGDSDPDPERYQQHQQYRLYDQQSLADFLHVSKKTLQNRYSSTPHSLPAAIQIPGARGPRWTPQSVQEWLNSRQQHTQKPAPVAQKRKAGRPRIAQVAVVGGAA
ncbi:MAG: hypothetical protein M0Z50_09265 [Planctomycetia bacterium]|nr:hypothetical protein [Planctomycetia bacterium]